MRSLKMKVTAVIPAAGLGRRLKKSLAKPLVKIAGREILIHTLKVLEQHPLINEIILATNQRDISKVKKIIKRYRINKIKAVIMGGLRRQDSVANALKKVSKDTDLVLIHDAVRPFIDSAMIHSVIQVAKTFGAAVVAVPVKATLKKSKHNLTVERTINRRHIWEIQTPQVFKKDVILEAYKKFSHSPVTDDASLVEKLGRKVKLVKGSYFNIKITTPEDLVIAEAITASRN